VGAEPGAHAPDAVPPRRRRGQHRSRGVRYFLVEGFEGFRRNGVMSAAAVTITMVTLLALGGALVVAATLDHIARHLERQMEVVAYLRDGLTPAQAGTLRDRLAHLPGVRSLDYVSKDEALTRFQQSMGGQMNVQDLLTRNPLPASYVLTADDPADLSAIAAAAREFPEVEDVNDGSQAAARLLRVTRIVRLAGDAAGAALALVALVIIASAIRLTVFARRAEIEVMRLVGATAWFIRWPFLVEGAITGGCGAGGAVLLVAGAYTVVAYGARASLPFLLLPAPEQVALSVSWKLVLWGVVIGIIGSVLAVRRYLRV
jgi:cell division transport system permease protein